VAGRARDLREAARQAAEAIDDGRARRLLARAVEASRS
jgi:anthranilate phosphoribosyltransferase